jgi:hypothetical protein
LPNMIKPNETCVVGHWLVADGQVVGDQGCFRIEELIADHLDHVAHSPDGWSSLYRDPLDGRLWERTYPQGQSHGGGPPSLVVVTQEQAFAKYGFAT